jgi:hypothetical protein
VNYEPGYALSKEGFVGGTFTYTQYEYGSAWCNRDVIYGEWLKTNRFRYALAGHAHRVGMYKCTPESRDNMLQRLGATARSNFSSLVDPTAISGRLLHPVDNAMNITKNSLPMLTTTSAPHGISRWGYTQVGIYSGDFDVTENPEPKMPSWFKMIRFIQVAAKSKRIQHLKSLFERESE